MFVRRFATLDPFVALIGLFILVYVAFALSPSSYGRVLQGFGVEEDGVLWGKPRRIRSDEYAIWTPLLQATVDSDFGQTNTTSLYGESLRTFYAMPLADWGLLFKPQFWAFFIVPGPWAYSFYFAAHSFLFLVGYYLLLGRFKVDPGLSALTSALLYWSPWTQLWWTSLGSIVAILPWALLLFLAPVPERVRLPATAWLTAMWLLSGQFYPQFLVPLCLTGAAAVTAFRPDTIQPRRLISSAVGVAIGGATACFYLREALAVALVSSNHGAREIAGGSVDPRSWLGLFQPMWPYVGFDSILSKNPCAISAAGSLLWLLIVVFADYKALGRSWRDPELGPRLRRKSAILLVPTITFSIWMLLPIPSAVGKILLLDKLPGPRLLFPVGLSLTLLALYWLMSLKFKWTSWRAVLFTGLIGLSWWPSAALGFKPEIHHGLMRLWRWGYHELFNRMNGDLYVLFPVVLIVVLWRQGRLIHLDPSGRRSLLTAAALGNIFAFSAFNPLQSAIPIFERPRSEQIEALAELQADHPRGWLVLGGGEHSGSVLNGYGFKSINHAFIHPHPEPFRKLFPDMPAEQFRKLFQRYGKLQLAVYQPPKWRQRLHEPMVAAADAVLTPYRPFLPPLPIKIESGWPEKALPRRGEFLSVERKGQRLRLRFRGEINGLSGASRLRVYVAGGAELLDLWVDPQPGKENWRGGQRLFSQIDLTLRLGEEAARLPGVCVHTFDPRFGANQVAPKPDQGRSLCKAVQGDTVFDQSEVLPDSKSFLKMVSGGSSST